MIPWVVTNSLSLCLNFPTECWRLRRWPKVIFLLYCQAQLCIWPSGVMWAWKDLRILHPSFASSPSMALLDQLWSPLKPQGRFLFLGWTLFQCIEWGLHEQEEKWLSTVTEHYWSMARSLRICIIFNNLSYIFQYYKWEDHKIEGHGKSSKRRTR